MNNRRLYTISRLNVFLERNSTLITRTQLTKNTFYNPLGDWDIDVYAKKLIKLDLIKPAIAGMKSPLFTYEEIQSCIKKLEDILDGKPIHAAVLGIYKRMVAGEIEKIREKAKQDDFKHWMEHGVKETTTLPLEKHIELYERAFLEFEKPNE